MSSYSSSARSEGRGSVAINPAELEEIAVVHMPCLVKDEDTIINMLGGSETIEKAIQNKTDLIQLKFPNTDPLRHHLIGTRGKYNGFVLKMARSIPESNTNENSSERKQETSNNDSFQVEVIGKTCHAYSFKNPSDYQFLAQSTEKTITHANYLGMSRTLEMISRPMAKPLLGTVNLPIFHDRKKFKKTQQDDAVPISIRNVGEEVPKPPELSDESLTARTRLRNIQRKIDASDTLKRLFEVVPIRSRKHLLEHPTLAGQNHLLLELLPRFVYCYYGGPYKGLLVRHGFDPEAHPDCRFLQVLQLRMPAATYRTIQQRVWEHLGKLSSYKRVNLDTLEVVDVSVDQSDLAARLPKTSIDYVICTFAGSVIKRQFSIQICSLMSEEMMTFVKSLPYLSKCTVGYGWFSATSLAVLREKVMELLQRQVDAFVTRPPEYATPAPVLSKPVQAASSSNNNSGSNTTSSSAPGGGGVGGSQTTEPIKGNEEAVEAMQSTNTTGTILGKPTDSSDELYAYKWCRRYLSHDGEINTSTATLAELEAGVAAKARAHGSNRKKRLAGMKLLQQLDSGFFLPESGNLEPRTSASRSSRKSGRSKTSATSQSSTSRGARSSSKSKRKRQDDDDNNNDVDEAGVGEGEGENNNYNDEYNDDERRFENAEAFQIFDEYDVEGGDDEGDDDGDDESDEYED